MVVNFRQLHAAAGRGIRNKFAHRGIWIEPSYSQIEYRAKSAEDMIGSASQIDTETLEPGLPSAGEIDHLQGGGPPLRLRLFKIAKEHTMAQAAGQKKAADYETKRTRDHNAIRRWAEKRGGRPTMVEGTQILRIDFDDPDVSRDEKLIPVSWDDFFRVFDERGLEFLYQEQTHDGHISRFNKFVHPGTDREQD